MSSFGGNSGQDWEAVNVGRSAMAKKPLTAADKAVELQKAKRTGAVQTQVKQFAAGNKSAGGGPMVTSAGAGALKIENETETFQLQKTGLGFGKALMQARMGKKMTQKDLGTKINEKPQIIQEYESGKAVPNPQIIGKIERALGVKLPRPPKVKKVKE